MAAGSVHEDELVRVGEEAGEVGEAVLPGVGGEFPGFVGLGRSAPEPLAGGVDLVGQGGVFLLEAGSEVFGLAGDEDVVPEGEGLLDGYGVVAVGNELVASRAIQSLKERVGERAEEEAIDAPAVGGGGVDVEAGVVDPGRDVDAGLEIKLPIAGATHAEVESAGGEEQGIADSLGVEAAAVGVAEESIVGVGGERGGKPVRGARDDQSAEGFDRAVGVVAEPTREPVEEFRVGRKRAHAAEVAGGVDEPAAKVLLPGAVDGGAPGERVVG